MSVSKFTGQKKQQILNSNLYSIEGFNNNSKPLQASERDNFKQDSVRLNVINKQDQTQKVSIIVKKSLLISHLKRRIQNQYSEARNTQFLIRVIQDENGFIFSNNSSIGQYVQSGQTIYIEIQHNKKGSNMNLPNNLTDLFVTLRYVTSSILQKLHKLQVSLSPSDLISELVHLGYWQSNSQIVISLIKLLKENIQKQLQVLDIRQNQQKNQSLLNLIYFWLIQVQNSYSIYPQVCFQIITLVQKLTESQSFRNLLKSNKIMKFIIQQSKNSNQSTQFKRCCINIAKNVNKNKVLTAAKSLNNHKSQYIPTIFEDVYEQFSLQQVLDMLHGTSQQSSSNEKALQILSRVKNKLVMQSTITFQNYWKLFQGLLKVKKPNEKRTINYFDFVFKQLMANTTISRCIQLCDHNFLKYVHHYLLQSSPQMHKNILNFTKNILQETSKKGQLNISSSVQYINSPYNQFQIFICQALQNNCINQIKTSGNYARYLPYIKDFVKLSLKTQSEMVSKSILKILSMICIDEQCRFQVINLKGIQVFIKCLMSSYKTKNIDSQRACAKGLLNLAVSSKQSKTKILSQMQQIISLYYKNSFDSVTQGYIQTILKPINKY